MTAQGDTNYTELWRWWAELAPEDQDLLCPPRGPQSSKAEVWACVDRLSGSAATDPVAVETEEELLHYREYQDHKVLMTYMPPFLLVFGTVGNVLAFIILTRRTMRRVSTYLYLAVLSITDTLVLHVDLLRLWIGTLTGYDIRDQADWMCKPITVLGYTVSDYYSVWLIIAVTVERYIAVCHPLQAPTMCNSSKAAKFIISIGVVIFAINFHFFFTSAITTRRNPTPLDTASSSSAGLSSSLGNGDGTSGGEVGNGTMVERSQCDATRGLEQLLEYWQWVDAFVYSFLPFVVLMVLNGRIISEVMRAKAYRSKLSQHVPAETKSLRAGAAPGGDTRKTGGGSGAGGGGGPTAGGGGGGWGGGSSSAHDHQESNIRLTAMLLTISFAFLITTLPMNIILILTTYWNSKLSSLPPYEQNHLLAQAMLLRTVTQLLMYANHSMNFYLYCAVGQKFRQELCRLLLRRSRAAASPNHSAASYGNATKLLTVRNGKSTRLTPSPRPSPMPSPLVYSRGSYNRPAEYSPLRPKT